MRVILKSLGTEMRVSVDTFDPGYCGQIPGLQIFLNGIKQNGVVTADDSLGVIVRYKRDSQGKYELDKIACEVLKETLWGEVKFIQPESQTGLP